jgi:hypothetical protein
MKRMQSAVGARWSWLAASVVLLGIIGVSVAFAHAQPRSGENSNVTIVRVEPDALSRPFPVASAGGMSAIKMDGVYEIYFNGTVFVPGLGPRQKLFVHVTGFGPDGWITVVFGDGIENKGMSDARVIAVEPRIDVQPPGPIEWRLFYASIAGVSPPLNPTGVTGIAAAQRWPE